VTAQTFTNLHSFTATSGPFPYYTNSDGANPNAGLVLSGNTLYGTAVGGGRSGQGSVFAVNTNGTGFTNLHTFTAFGFGGTNSDGANPYAGLILSNNTLYGTAHGGGSSGYGTVFKVYTDGTSFTNLHSFTAIKSGSGSETNSDGAGPQAGLILSGNTLYGTAHAGGSSGNGTVFKVNTDGTGFTNLHSFTAASGSFYTNSDGADPVAGLILSGNTLYGTAHGGGSSGYGTVFAINTNGTGFTNLHAFTAPDRNYGTNSDGAYPSAGLILSGDILYGTAYEGGSSGNGTVFAINTNGTGFTNLYSFTALDENYQTNSDGANPTAGLILSGNTLYGTAASGGSSDNGTVFNVNTNGTGFTNLYSFTAGDYNSSGNYTNSDGVYPDGELILSGNTLYGTAESGGSSGNGTVFSLSLGSVSAPLLTITYSGNEAIVSWPSSVMGWTLQTNNNLATGTWGKYLGAIVNNNVTNSPPTGNLFFRLSNP